MLRGSVVLLIALALPAAAEPDLLTMGAGWFARLKNPNTRVAALYEHQKARNGEDNVPGPEHFAAMNVDVSFFACPQPGKPGAWAIVNTTKWQDQKTLLYRTDEDDYPPHPLETERRAKREKESGVDTAFEPWQPGQPWNESLYGFLVDESGNELDEGYYASPGIIADFNGDGMLDLLEISRLSLKGPKQYANLVSIGPLEHSQPRFLMLYCDFRVDVHAPRTKSFSVRKNQAGKLELLVSTHATERKETAFGYDGKQFGLLGGELPGGMLMDLPSITNPYEAATEFLKTHGMDTWYGICRNGK